MRRILFVVLSIMVSCCSDNEPTVENAQMSIRSCYIVRSNTLSENFYSPIGIYLLDETGQPYDGSYKNSASLISGNWSMTDPVYIVGRGMLYAYYPYSVSDDPTSLPVNASSQVDLLYSKTPANIGPGSSSPDIKLYHAMSHLSVSVEDEEIIALSLSSPLTAQFNVCSGEFSNPSVGPVNVSSSEMLIIPHTASGTELKITLKTNVEYTYSVDATIFLPGETYTYLFQLNENREKLDISSFSVEEWVNRFTYTDYL